MTPRNRLTGNQPSINPHYDPSRVYRYPSPPPVNALDLWLEWSDDIHASTGISRSMQATLLGIKSQHFTNILHGRTSATDLGWDMMRKSWRNFLNLAPMLNVGWASSKQTMITAIMELEHFMRNPVAKTEAVSYAQKVEEKESTKLWIEYSEENRISPEQMDSMLVYHGINGRLIEPHLWRSGWGLNPPGFCKHIMRLSERAVNQYVITTHLEGTPHPKEFWRALAMDPSVEEGFLKMKKEQIMEGLSLLLSEWVPWPDEVYDRITYDRYVPPRVSLAVSDEEIYNGLKIDPFTPEMEQDA